MTGKLRETDVFPLRLVEKSGDSLSETFFDWGKFPQFSQSNIPRTEVKIPFVSLFVPSKKALNQKS